MPALVVSAPSESRRLIRRRRWNLVRGIMALLTVGAIGVVGFKVIEGEGLDVDGCGVYGGDHDVDGGFRGGEAA